MTYIAGVLVWFLVVAFFVIFDGALPSLPTLILVAVICGIAGASLCEEWMSRP